MVRRFVGRLPLVATLGLLVPLLVPASPGIAVVETADVAAAPPAEVGTESPGARSDVGSEAFEGSSGFGRGEGPVVVAGDKALPAIGDLAPPVVEELVQPEASVGLGRYIYVYLDRGDWNYLGSLGRTVAGGALCRLLAKTLPTWLACTIGGFIVGRWVIERAAPPAGWCREFKFRYPADPYWAMNSFAGTKLVRRSC